MPGSSIAVYNFMPPLDRETPLAERPVHLDGSRRHDETGLSENVLDRETPLHDDGGRRHDTDVDSACMPPLREEEGGGGKEGAKEAAADAGGDEADGLEGGGTAWKVGLKVAWDIETPAVLKNDVSLCLSCH